MLPEGKKRESSSISTVSNYIYPGTNNPVDVQTIHLPTFLISLYFDKKDNVLFSWKYIIKTDSKP
jgi:hypothetical protein